MSYLQLLYHAIIRTKASMPTLSLEHSDNLYRYIWSVIENRKSILHQINGIENHLHILFTLHPTIAISDFMRDLKAETSKMLKHTIGFEQFTGWSEGYAALTYSLRDKNMLINYIKNQREHHKIFSFKNEYITTLKQMGLYLDERDWNR